VKKILAHLTTVAMVMLAIVLGWFAWEHTLDRPGLVMREYVPM